MEKTNNMVKTNVNMEKTNHFNIIKTMIDTRLSYSLNKRMLFLSQYWTRNKPAESARPNYCLNYCRQQDGADGRAQVTWKNRKEPTG